MLDVLKKMFRNKIFYCFLILIVIMFPQTIYMQSDNNTKLVVTTLGIDKEEDGYSVTSLAVIPKVSTDVNANLEIFQGKGKSISEALQNISLNTGKHVGLAHCDCIIVSLEVLKENISQVLDYFIRTSNLTTNATILATENKSSELIEASKSSNNLLDLTLKDIVTYEEQTTLLDNTTIERFYRAYFSKSGTFFMPIINVEESNDSSGGSGGQGSDSSSGNDGASSGDSSGQGSQSKISNKQDIAIITDGKYVRTLSEDERFIYNLLSGSSKYLTIEVENINDEYVNDSVEIYQQVSKVRLPLYKFDDGKPYVQYEVWLNIMMEEINSKNNYAFASIDALQNFLSETAEKKLLESIDEKRKKTVELMHTEKNDILNLYNKFNAFNHKKWEKYLETLTSEEDYLSGVDIRINLHLGYVI